MVQHCKFWNTWLDLWLGSLGTSAAGIPGSGRVSLVDSTEVYVAHWLLELGADVCARDRPFGREPIHYARKLPPPQRQLVQQMLVQKACEGMSPYPCRPSWKLSKILYSPPPHGYEEFFAKAARDPEAVENCEDLWLLLRGRKSLRTTLEIDE